MDHKFTRLVLCLLVCFSTALPGLAQTTYYVASTGNDANDGRSAGSPFQSLSKVNALMLQPGDAVLFRRGDTLRGTLLVRQSGTAQSPIQYGSFGAGPKPVLAGSKLVGNWTKVGTNRWQAPCADCGSEVTGLYRNGKAQPLGRYPNPDAPNRGSLTVQSHTGVSQLTTKENLTVDWTGAEIVLFPGYWIIDRAAITGQQGNTLQLNNPSTYPITDSWPCYIQNHPATLDQPGEWAYNSTSKIIQLYDTGNPNGQSITATAADYAIDLTDVSFVVLKNLHVVQARAANLHAANVSHVRMMGVDVTDAGEDGLTIEGTGKTIQIDSSTIADCNNNGLFIGPYQDFTFQNSSIRRVGLMPGRGKSGDGQFIGFQSQATQNTLIENNRIDSVGYAALTVANNSTIRYNRISNFCMVKSDGGGIYLFNGNRAPLHDIRVQSNIIQNGIGTYGALSDNVLSGAHGIFLDDCVENVDVTNNTVADCHGLGMLMHAVNHVNVVGNTCVNNDIAQFMLYNYNAPCLPRLNTIRQNVLVAKNASQGVVNYISGNNDLAQFGRMDHNYYARPFKELSTVRAVYNGNMVDSLNVPQWQAQFGQDAASKPSPITYKEYVLKSLSGTASFSDTFDKDVNGWQTWSPLGNSQLTQRTGMLDGGSLQINIPQPSAQRDSYSLLFKGVTAVTKAQTYLLRFDATAPVNKKMVVFIRQRGGPYRDLTRRFEFMVGPVRQRFEFALTVSASEADPLLAFQLRDEAQSVFFDNMWLQQANAEPVNPDDFIKLIYNPTHADSVVVLDKPYRDVKNHYYARQATLKPFTSIVLLRDTLPPVDIRLTMKASRTTLKTGDTTTVSLSLRSQGTLAPTSRVQWTCQLPASLSLVSGGGLVYADSMLTGTVQQLRTDTTFSFRVKAMATGSFALAAEVTEATYADPTSTPNSGTQDGEDDMARLTLLVSERTATDTTAQSRPDTTAALVTASEPVLLQPNAVYPNPTVSTFMFTAETDIATLRVVDLLGRERFLLGPVKKGQPVQFGQQFPPAWYLLTIDYQTGEKRSVRLYKQ